MTFEFSKRARSDIKNITRYTLENFGLAKADEYLDGLYKLFDLLTDNPKFGREWAGGGRRCVSACTMSTTALLALAFLSRMSGIPVETHFDSTNTTSLIAHFPNWRGRGIGINLPLSGACVRLAQRGVHGCHVRLFKSK
jgi:ParE toxin of type II toxin-antitoxin system, parDE